MKLLELSFLILVAQTGAFSHSQFSQYTTTPLSLSTNDGDNDQQQPTQPLLYSRQSWFQAAAMASVMIAGPNMAFADEEITTSLTPPPPPSPALAAAKTKTIEKCSTSSKYPCVSTSNVKNLDLYLPPWTYDPSQYSSVEVLARIKGALMTDPTCQILPPANDEEAKYYLKAQVKRSDLFWTIDEVEFLVDEEKQVVFFRSLATSSDFNDFGTNKKRLEDIRKKAGIFGVMGESLNSADSVSDSERGYGPLGQLKAFYGLQSGGGFEDVLSE
ncbi:unnamed protein product [Cylindrotheca closterium]|uniref:Uncharacterized protein n=1 Tax=Cylindrotheca closterium TaxID=2856 RepID=A0AAD2FIN8_9STRA|nr:unnamed protein product [Cylindrotheca closterium]